MKLIISIISLLLGIFLLLFGSNIIQIKWNDDVKDKDIRRYKKLFIITGILKIISGLIQVVQI